MLVAGIRQARKIAGGEPLAGHITGEDARGDQVRSDDELRAWIRRTVRTSFHPTSICAMGGADTAVCDPELRVRVSTHCASSTPR